jgi:hypothetical protein
MITRKLYDYKYKNKIILQRKGTRKKLKYQFLINQMRIF